MLFKQPVTVFFWLKKCKTPHTTSTFFKRYIKGSRGNIPNKLWSSYI